MYGKAVFESFNKSRLKQVSNNGDRLYFYRSVLLERKCKESRKRRDFLNLCNISHLTEN
jgi:hypothetical protein